MRDAPLIVTIMMLTGCMGGPSPTPSPTPPPTQVFEARGTYTGQVQRNLAIREMDANDVLVNVESRTEMVNVTVTFDDMGRLLNETGQPIAIGDVIMDSFNDLDMTLTVSDVRYSLESVVVSTQATALVGDNNDRAVAGEMPIVYRTLESGGEGIECVNEGTLNETAIGDTHFQVLRGQFGTLAPVANP